ncbi:MAG: flagellar biosynthesis protein FlgB [Pseudomonadota bacterium]
MITEGINLLEMLKTKMAYDGERQKILAQNIASQGVPDYKAKDLLPLDFKSVMQKNNAQSVNISVTSPMHLSGTKQHTNIFGSANMGNTFDITPNGNSSVAEEQMMKVAENATDYQMTVNLYKKAGNLIKQALGLSPSA